MVEDFTVQEIQEALDGAEPQADWPTWEQEAKIRHEISMTLYRLAMEGHIDPTRIRACRTSPVTVAGELTKKLVDTLKSSD